MRCNSLSAAAWATRQISRIREKTRHSDWETDRVRDRDTRRSKARGRGTQTEWLKKTGGEKDRRTGLTTGRPKQTNRHRNS